jgi:hypothetical protein
MKKKPTLTNQSQLGQCGKILPFMIFRPFVVLVSGTDNKGFISTWHILYLVKLIFKYFIFRLQASFPFWCINRCASFKLADHHIHIGYSFQISRSRKKLFNYTLSLESSKRMKSFKKILCPHQPKSRTLT